MKSMLKVERVAIACFAALQSLSFAGLPVSAAQISIDFKLPG